MRIKFRLLSLLLLIFWKPVLSQPGCTDPQALNYNSLATINDGSCTYPPTNLTLNLISNLSTPLLDGSSGLMMINGNAWTHVDHTDHSIYLIDTLSSNTLQQITINSVINTDWEDMATSNDHVFIGDFGNNYGNRTDLHILKIAKSDITASATNVNAEIINFSYPDQTSFVTLLNNNSFDCEAFIFYNDSLHLFTKDWVNKITKHYTVPAVQGTYTALLVDSFNVNCLITSAAIQHNGVVVLLGYDNTGFAPCYIWMLNDYQGSFFFSGNKRMFSLGSAAINGQVEGIDFANNSYGYITNERFQQFTFNVPPQLKSFNLSNYLPAVTNLATLSNQQISIKVSPVPSNKEITLSIIPFSSNNKYKIIITDLNGKIVLSEKIAKEITKLNIENLHNGVFIGKIIVNDNTATVLKIVKN